MDVQRAKRRGKPNLWVVIPIKQQSTIANLREVQLNLENKYKKLRAELRKGFIDLSSAEIHITLFGIHANKARTEKVKEALHQYEEHLKSSGKSEVFDLELKGLGAWTTKSNCVCLYADFGKESCQKVKQLAKSMRDFVKAYMSASCNEGIDNETNSSVASSTKGEEGKEAVAGLPPSSRPLRNSKQEEEEEEDEEDKEKEDEDEDEEESDPDLPKNTNRVGSLQVQRNVNRQTPQRVERDESENDDDCDDVEGNDNGSTNREGDEALQDGFWSQETDSEEDLEVTDDGFWLDDPKEGIYIPHLTLLKTDSKWDKKLRTTLNDHRGRAGGKPSKKDKGRGRGGGGGRDSPEEPYGWNFSLFRDLRIEYSKMVFGVETVTTVELQQQFKTFAVVTL